MIQTTLDDLLQHEFRESAIDRLMSPAREAGEQAANACAQKAGDDFMERAKAFIHSYLNQRNQAPGEIIVDLAKKAGITPHDDRAFGTAFSSLARKRLIQCVGFCERKKGHGTAGGRIWAIVR